VVDVAILILNWNNTALTLRCVDSVLEALKGASVVSSMSRVLVIDNGSERSSRDKLVNAIASYEPSIVSLVLNEENVGYGSGMNLGLAAVAEDVDYVWLLNNDVVVDVNSVSALIEYSENNQSVKIVGATMKDINTSKVYAHGGFKYHPLFAFSQPARARQRWRATSQFDYVDGAAIWLQGGFLRRIGGLSEHRFLYFEELELARRLEASEEQGWCASAVVFHQRGATRERFGTSTPLEKYWAYRGAFSYTRMHYPLALPTVVLSRFLQCISLALIRRRAGHLAAFCRAIGEEMFNGSVRD